LSGCGVRDGSEIHEAVFALLAIDRNGAEALCMAPDVEFMEVNHLTMEETGAKRNALQEAARIARGNIRDIRAVKASDLDALVLPGGFGAAKNLSDFAVKGSGGTVHPEVSRLLNEMSDAKKPVGAICIAPSVIALTLGRKLSPLLTIGNDPGTASEIEKSGARHSNCDATGIVIDSENRIVTTPAYMLAGRISETCDGIEKCVRALIEMA